MRVLIIEDEKPAALRLSKMILAIRPAAEIIDVIDSVETAVAYLSNFNNLDLIFMDIQLADGLSFDIFRQVELKTPVVFTTAYDQYALKAFKVNSVDYLLKPIDPEELETAIVKYETQFQQNVSYDIGTINKLLESIAKKEYKSRFLVRIGNQLTYINTTDIAYFKASDGVVQAICKNKKSPIIDHTLDQLEQMIDPKEFFRISRKFLIGVQSIRNIHSYFNSRLKIDVDPSNKEEMIVSRDRVSFFKEWLDK